MGAFFGILFHAIGGFAAGSFYIPFKLIQKWSWETAWLVLGLSAWIISPLLVAWITVPNLNTVLFSAGYEIKLYTFLFGVLWGIGGLTFGLSLRYLGIGLGMAITLGFTAAFGTLIPPLYDGTFNALIRTPGGFMVLVGILVCLLGIVIAGRAGMLKEKELDKVQQKVAIVEFNLRKGVVIAVVSGILSACFAFGLAAGRPIAKIAMSEGVDAIFQNNAVLVWILWGGFLSNFIWTIILGIKNKTLHEYYNPKIRQKNKNYLLASIGGLTWYLQFFFYGMGTTKLGKELEFASWTLHIAFIILFSTAWGVYFNEWKGASKKTMYTLWSALGLIIISTLLIGIGNSL